MRRRASFACGVTETDTGGLLTVDHFRPQACGGDDDFENLLYCCYRCNLYKASYWPAKRGDPVFWNPREDGRDAHLLTLADGTLHPLTPAGAFTVKRLRLNRPPLVAYRFRKQVLDDEERLLARLQEVFALLERLQEQQAALLKEQSELLAEKRRLVQLLLKSAE